MVIDQQYNKVIEVRSLEVPYPAGHASYSFHLSVADVHVTTPSADNLPVLAASMISLWRKAKVTAGC